jgi:hypothetical protein
MPEKLDLPDETKREKFIHARVSADLYESLEWMCVVNSCDMSELIRTELEYAAQMRELSRWIVASQELGSHMSRDDIKELIRRLTGSNEQVRKFVKKQQKLKRATQEHCSPAMLEAMIKYGPNAGSTIKAFQPTDNGEPDKIANRTTEAGFRLGGTTKPPTMNDDENASEILMPASAMTTISSGGFSRKKSGAIKPLFER